MESTIQAKSVDYDGESTEVQKCGLGVLNRRLGDGGVTFSYKKHKSRRTRYMKLDAEDFMSRFLQHSLPTGFMKVRYYGFMHPCSGVPLEKVRTSIEMMHGFDVMVSETPREVREKPRPICPDCGGELRYRCMG